MNEKTREIAQGKQWQGVDEEIPYTLTTTKWGSSPSSVSVKAYTVQGETFTDVSSTVLSGSPSVNGDIITLPVLKSLVEGVEYRIEMKFTCSGNVFESWATVFAQR